MRKSAKLLILTLLIMSLTSCAYKHFTSDYNEVAIPGIDVKQSLIICEAIMNREKDGENKPQTLGYWALRAQKIDSLDANNIERVYFKYIDKVAKENEFFLWHYTWAIADFYRLGDDTVKRNLESAYKDAVKRGIEIDKKKFVDGDKLLLGYFHFGGWAAAKKFLVVPNNKKFNQSTDEFFNKYPEYYKPSK